MRKVASGPAPFSRDVDSTGTYLYSGDSAPLSSRIANQRHSELVLEQLERIRPKRILDVGCGDGEQTLTLLSLGEVEVVAIDPSDAAIDSARERFAGLGKVTFVAGTVEDLPEGEIFDVVVIRSVLHHVDDPETLVRKVAAFSDWLVVLEPNGLNPILKLIEAMSPYHRAHNEMSFSKWRLRRWFENSGYLVEHVSVGGLVPFFFPSSLAKLLHWLEPKVEKLWLARWVLCGVQIYRCRLRSGT